MPLTIWLDSATLVDMDEKTWVAAFGGAALCGVSAMFCLFAIFTDNTTYLYAAAITLGLAFVVMIGMVVSTIKNRKRATK